MLTYISFGFIKIWWNNFRVNVMFFFV
jgi:hypothetical protein